MSISFHNSVLLPNVIKYEALGPNKARLIVEPAYPGYGVTLGNALRRVLLSSLPGSATVAAKFHGVEHEFSSINGVKEDLVDIIINLKKIKYLSHSSEPVKIKLLAKGAKVVTGADIVGNSDVSVVNPEQIIATLTEKSSVLDLDLTVATGLGFVPVEAREKEKLDIGEIALDAWFSPVLRVAFDVEHVRVGKMVNFDRLLMDIETDGSVTPEDAVNKAASILVDHFQLFSSLAGQNSASQLSFEDKTDSLSAEIDDSEAKPTKKKAAKK